MWIFSGVFPLLWQKTEYLLAEDKTSHLRTSNWALGHNTQYFSTFSDILQTKQPSTLIYQHWKEQPYKERLKCRQPGVSGHSHIMQRPSLNDKTTSTAAPFIQECEVQLKAPEKVLNGPLIFIFSLPSYLPTFTIPTVPIDPEWTSQFIIYVYKNSTQTNTSGCQSHWFILRMENKNTWNDRSLPMIRIIESEHFWTIWLITLASKKGISLSIKWLIIFV